MKRTFTFESYEANVCREKLNSQQENTLTKKHIKNADQSQIGINETVRISIVSQK